MRTKIIVSVFCWALAACSTQAINKNIDHEMAATPSVQPGGPMARAMHNIIAESKELSETQKNQLLALHKHMAEFMGGNRMEMGKLKVVFMKSLLDPQVSSQKIEVLRKRILRLDRAKLNKMISSMEEAKKILGRTNIEDRRLFKVLVFEHESESFN